MDGRDLFRLIFWSWLAISTFLLVRRFQRRQSAKDDEKADPGAGGVSDEMSKLLRPKPMPAPLPDPARPLPPSASTAPAHSIFDPEPSPSPRARPLAELVEGIAMPCDLAPLVDHTNRPGAIEAAVFITSGFGGGEVGRGLADALRRLGYELEPLDETEAVATRGGDRLNIAVHTDPSTVERHGTPAFPTATSGDTVAELWTD